MVRCPTQKYNTKVRLGRGFTLHELKEAGVSAKYARTVGIAVDARRKSKSEESVKVNADRLKDYMSRLVVFTKSKKPTDVSQLTGPLVAAPAKPSAVSFVELNDEMKAFRAVNALRVARADSRLVGIRKKQAAVEKKEDTKDE
jgi:large subunit ribosomal protein L13e